MDFDCGFEATDALTSEQQLRRFGPTVHVEVGYDEVFDYKSPFGVGRKPPFSVGCNVPALIDTGAVISCIDEQLAQDVGLALVDQQKIAGVDGEVMLNVYLAHIYFSGLGQLRWGRFTGARLSKGAHPQQVLLGRDFLQGTIMIYDGQTGAVRLSRA